MAKGYRTQGSGRAVGTPNKVTREIRKALADFVSGNVNDISAWLKSIKNPEKRIKLLLLATEYCVPKMQRVEWDLQAEPIENIVDEIKRREAQGAVDEDDVTQAEAEA